MTLDIVGFGFIFLVLANSEGPGDVVLVASSDAILMFVVALFGCFFNLLLAMALWRGGLRTRRLEAELRAIQTRSLETS